MATLIDGANCEDAWIKAVDHLLSYGPSVSNLVVSISNPLYFQSDWLTRFDPRGVVVGANWIRDVINTVFPQKTYDNSANRHAFYQRYLKAHRRAKSGRWGTYFERLIQFGSKKENQLERIINALNGWKNNPHAALTIHLSSAETDTLRPLGAPCWHFGELLCPDSKTIELVVVYRNHDYFNKALGNFIGLARLLNFLCKETGRVPGQLVCHSVRAYYDSSKSKITQLKLK